MPGIISRLEKRSSLVNPEKWLIDWFAGGRSDTTAGVNVTAATALYCGVVYACIDILSRTVGSLPLYLYRRLPESGKELAREHPLFKLTRRRPNPEMTAMRYRSTLQGHLASYGNAYSFIDWELTGKNAGYPAALWPLRPDRINVTRKNGKLIYTYYPGLGEFKEASSFQIPTGAILHIPGFGFDGTIGYSPIALARQAIGLNMAAEEFGARYFGSGVHPSMIFEHPGRMKEPKAMREALTDVYGGLGKSHRIMLIEEGMKATPITIRADEAQFVETRKFQISEIARIYHVPPHMLADVEKSTSWGCLAPDTPVLMADGRTVPAQNILAGDRVIGWDGKSLVPAIVALVAPRPAAPRLKVVTANGRSIVVTEDHPFWAMSPQSKGHSIVTSRRAEWIPASGLVVGSHVLPALGAPVVGTGELDADAAWLLGLFIGDGHVQSSGNAQVMVGDYGVREKLTAIVGALGGEIVEHPRPQDGRSLTLRINYNAKGAPGRRAPLRLLLDNACGSGASKTVPDIVMRSGPEAWAGFLAGWFDADGCAKPLCAVWDTIGRDLAERGQQMLANLGINASIDVNEDAYRLSVRHRDYRNRFRVTVGPYIASVKASKLPSALPPSSRPHAQAWDRIVAIESLPAAPTIAIQVENGINSHVTGGLVTHNTGIEEQNIGFITHTMRPWFVLWEEELGRMLLLEDEEEEYFFEFDLMNLLRGDAIKRWSAYIMGKRNGVLNADEIRAWENLNPIPDGLGQEYIIERNMQSLTELGLEKGSGGEPIPEPMDEKRI